MDLSQTLVPASHVMTCEVGGELIMLDHDHGCYFGLGPVGTRVWNLLSDGLPLAAVCEEIVREFDVTYDEASRDLLALAEDLFNRRLLLTPAGA